MNARLLRRVALTVALASIACGLALLSATSSATAGPPGGKKLDVRTVTSWPWVDPWGSFAESLALGRDGSLYASVTTWGDDDENPVDVGQVVKIDPRTGARKPFGDSLATPGFLTGLAFDEHGHLYVANATFSEDPAPGVYLVDAKGAPTRVLTLPAESFPNGLAFHGGWLYIADSALGIIWRWQPGAAAATQWLTDDRLLPGTGDDDHGIGANGIAFRGGDLLVTVADAGRVVQVKPGHDGAAGKVEVVSEQPELVSVDGIEVDGGDVWLVTNEPTSGRLLSMAKNGKLTIVADQPEWLDYPTQPVVGPKDVLYVENGSFDNGVPGVVAIGKR
jgi:sugar lactone lactonase YvrE